MLSILSEPSFVISYKLKKQAKNKIKSFLKNPFLKYSGHYALVRSLIEGLEKIAFKDYNYNPNSISKVGNVLVLINGHRNALVSAIKLKKRGKIEKLVVGPNLDEYFIPDSSLFASNQIDLYLTPSEWTANFCTQLNPIIAEKIVSWPAGVDEEFWNIPSGSEKSKSGKKLLFFKKRPEIQLYENCKTIAERQGYEVTELIPGHYTLSEYKLKLQETDYVVHFVEQESQGISLAEAWAMNVPTIVWNPEFWHYNLQNFRSSSAPYLTNKTGVFFRTEIEFEELIKNIAMTSFTFSPRNWVLENMTDNISARLFLDILNKLK